MGTSASPIQYKGLPMHWENHIFSLVRVNLSRNMEKNAMEYQNKSSHANRHLFP